MLKRCGFLSRTGKSILISLCSVFLLLSCATDAAGAVRAESLRLRILPENRQILAAFTVAIKNSSTIPMEQQQFFLYPEMFDENFLEKEFGETIEGRTVYPGSFALLSLERRDGKNVNYVRNGPAFLSLLLDPPLQPGEEISVTFRYMVRVPNHYSCFSSVRGNVYINGAFYPLPVSRSEGRMEFSLDDGPVELTVHLPRGGKMLLIPHRDGYLSGRDRGRVSATIKNGREIGLFFADFEEISLGSGDTKAILFAEKISGRERKKIVETVERVARFLKEHHPELLVELDRLLVIEAPLRKRVSFFTSYGVVVSDRIFESIKLFQSQHQEALIESIFSFLASRKSAGPEYVSRFYSEFVGEILTEEFREFSHLRIGDLRKKVEPVTFIPVFDRIYYERQMPFARSYIRTVYQFGFPGEDFPATEKKRVTGDSIYRVVKSYSKDFQPEMVVSEYFREKDLLSILATWELDDDFLSLLDTDPESDYGVVSARSREGQNEVTVENTMADAPREVVKVLVALDDGTERELAWDTEEKRKTLIVPSPPGTEIENVTVDPDLVMEDTNRSNNYLKRPLRILLQATRFSYDFNTKDFSGSVLLNFKRAYDPVHSYFLRLQTSDDSSGMDFFYRRAIKLKRYGGLFWQGGVKYTREKSLAPSQENIVEGVMSLDYSSFQFPFFPVKDIRGLAGFSAGFLGRDGRKQFYTLSGRVIKYLQIDLKDTIAFKLDTGIVWGSVPEVRLLELGGRDHIRGIKSDDAEVENFAVGTVELRHVLTNDLDVDLPWGIFTFHGLAMNLFVDGGAGEFPGGALPGSSEFRVSGGLGLFFTGNLVGIAEVKLNFEFARELNRFSDNSTLFYFKLNQSF